VTLTLEGLGPPASLRLPGPVLGIDPSTLRMSAGVLLPAAPTRAEWSTQTLQRHPSLTVRQMLAGVAIEGWLERLQANYGPFVAVGVEVPLSGGMTVSLSSFYVIGVLLEQFGRVMPDAELLTFGPGEWKLPATGSGYAPGVGKRPPKTAPKAERDDYRKRARAAELARIEQWARDACGWTGLVGDEAAGLGVATAVGVTLAQRVR
jgi:hypothetical protein